MNVILSLAAQVGVSLVKPEECDLLLVRTSVRHTVGLPCDIKGVLTNDQKKLRGWCKYEVSWGSMCRNLGMCFTEIIMLSLHIFFIEV